MILIPNRHLETPHHHIERLRHDDPRLEDIKTSFDMVDAPSTDMSWAPKEQEVKAKPEALVKGITPSQPAPVSSASAKKPVAAETEASPGFFKRLMGWLSGGSKEEKKVEETPKPTEARGERGRNGQGNRGNGNRGGQHRGRRPEHRNDARPGAEASTDTDNRRPPRDEGAGRTAGAEQSDDAARQGGRNPRGRGRHRRDEGDSRQDGTDGAQAVNTAAGVQASGTTQAPRQPHGPRTEATNPAQADDQRHLQNGPEGQPGSDDDNSGDPERKRRRRRSRRGKRGQDEGSGFENEDGSSSGQQAETQAQPNSGVTTQAAPLAAPAPLQTHVAPTYQAPASQAYVAPVHTAAAVQPAAAPAATPVAQAPAAPAAYVAPAAPAAYVNVGSATEPVASAAAAAPAPAPAPAAVAASVASAAVAAPAPMAAPAAPVAPAPVAVAAPASVAIEAPAPAITAPAPAPVADLATLHAIVRSAGLQWIESDPIRVAQTLAEQPTVSVKLGRERKPAVVISSEPLVQVETRV